ncbi:hypothetical protein D3C86_1720520 [compost metagenome]
MVEAALRRWMRGRLAYSCCSLASSASRLAMSLDSCSVSNVGAATAGLVTGLGSSVLVAAFFCFGATVVTAALGGASCCSGLAAGGGVTFCTLLSWNGAISVVLGIAFLSRVPLPCWFSWARKSAFSGFFSLLNVARVISRVRLICLGSTTANPTPSSKAR